MNPLLSRVKQDDKRKKFRAYSSISTISNDYESIKLPPVSNR